MSALRPGASEITTNVAAAISDRMYFRGDKWRGSYHYIWFFWLRILIVGIMIAAPVSFVALSLWSLTGYSAFLAFPLARSIVNKNVDERDSTTKAYKIVETLKQGWAEHGNALYAQMWAHDPCDGREHDHYQHRFACRGRTECDVLLNCSYCNDRLREIMKLQESQRSVEARSIEPVNNMIFEASEQFRKAVAEELENRDNATDLMKAISASVKL